MRRAINRRTATIEAKGFTINWLQGDDFAFQGVK